MTGRRIYLSGKEDSKGPALRSKRPRSDRENGEDEGRPDEGARVIAATYHARCNRTRVDKEGAGIRPFLELRRTRRKQGYASRQFPQSQDREQVLRVAKVRQYLGDGLASYKLGSPMHQVCHPTCQKLERDDCGGRPIADHFHFHRRVSFNRDR
jgi:hypothetical protein